LWDREETSIPYQQVFEIAFRCEEASSYIPDLLQVATPALVRDYTDSHDDGLEIVDRGPR
jgi:hypothetical protein